METNARRHSVDNSCMQMNGQTFGSGNGMQESCESNMGARSSFGCPNAQSPANGESYIHKLMKVTLVEANTVLRFAFSNVD